MTELWEEIRENSWIEVESGDQAFRQDRQVDLLCKRNAELEAEIEREQRHTAEAHAALAESARLFASANLDCEPLRQVLCDQQARSMAFRLREDQEAKDRRLDELEDKLSDALSGLEYIRMRYGALDGVGWDRLGLPANTEEQP